MLILLSPMVIFFTMIMTSLMSAFLMTSTPLIILEWKISSLYFSPFYFSILLDSYGMIFISVILFISYNILVFSKHYMLNELFLSRFTKLIFLFITSMCLLVIFPNLIILLLGWDGLGMSSFLLIIFYQNSSSLAAGMITSLINRLGDILLIFSVVILTNLGQWMALNLWSFSLSSLLAWSLLVAGMTKSAQMPFSSWLPAAMEAPTPVSALVHSSTLVTAGIFLLFRFYPLLSQFSSLTKTLMLFSSLTMLMASMSASVQFDMKKIIALSTLSQLGLMMFSLSVMSPMFTFFHLITHAMFKALLFLCAGTIIFYMNHSQDTRLISNLTKTMPITSSCLLVATLALCGIPFLAGFFSKDLILEESFMSPLNFYIYIIILASTGLTTTYSLRMLIAILWSPQLFFPFKNTSNSVLAFIIPMLTMSFFSIIMGSLMNWLIIPPLAYSTPPMLKLMVPLMILTGAILPFFTNTLIKIGFPLTIPSLYFYSSMWLLSPLVSQTLIKHSIFKPNLLFKYNETSWLETFINKTSFFSPLSSLTFLVQLPNLNKSMMLVTLIALPLIFFY
uniref:NADH-ubiquinone oxidoreductase chain 5 n=1 Tax=Siboglinum plumosum TaxID=3080496 RepID=A0AA96WS21_9ANNE|nr:NADH dehydrogenase subunit 5 [Siboglinum plumosum]WNZ34606.1 NADH dehydrogenase subunit 5 [Siboglinum plumosum]